MKQKLNFHAGEGLVPDFDALLNAKIKRYVGRLYNKKTMSFESTELPQSVEYRSLYVKYAKEGKLVPADAATAKICGLPFTNKKTE
jgi:hypothetical protein